MYLAYWFLSHPLRHIPGPLLCKVFPGWITYHAFRDTLQEAVLQAHETYSDVVCVGPTTVLVRTPEAVTKVLGYGANHLSKSSDYGALVFHTPSVFSETNKQAHTRKRRIAAQAYSMNSIVNLEHFVDSNVEKFVKKLNSCAATDEALDLCDWFKFYAFDVIGDLAFGRSFGMMERGSAGEFVTQISGGIEYTFVVRHLPNLSTVMVCAETLIRHWAGILVIPAPSTAASIASLSCALGSSRSRWFQSRLSIRSKGKLFPNCSYKIGHGS